MCDTCCLQIIKDQSTWRKTVQESVDDIICESNKISYDNIFEGIEHLHPEIILLEGRPGSGKTTLMNKIKLDWANRAILQSKLVLYLPLRRLNAESDCSLTTIVRLACPILSQGHYPCMFTIYYSIMIVTLNGNYCTH